MAIETQRPTGELSDIGLVTNSELDHDHDPDSDTTIVEPTANNVNTEWGADFDTPTGNPTTGLDKQEFRAGVQRFQTGQSGTPNARIELWENGSLVRAESNTPLSDGNHTIITMLWDASELATPDGSLVQMKVIGTKVGGAGGTRAAVSIGGMEWNVEYDVAGGNEGAAMYHHLQQMGAY